MSQPQLGFELLPYQEEVVPIGVVEDIDLDRRIKLWSLLERMASVLEVPEDYATNEDVAHADPGAMEKGLYVPKFGPQWRTAEGKVDVPKQFASEAAQNSRWLMRQGKNPAIPPPDITVIFPSVQAKPIGYYAKALADRARTSTRAANIDAADRDEVTEKVGRAAHHQLEGYLQRMSSLERQLTSEHKTLKSLDKELRSHWRGHYKPRNLDKRRNEAEDVIHLTVETSAVTLNMDDVAIKGLHKAIRFNLYGLSQAEQESMWKNYLILVGRHSAAKIDRVASCIRACRAEMDVYQPFVDRKAQKEAEQASE